MEHLIASYLFRNNYCPLPAIGKLRLSEKSALVSHSAKLIDPPQPMITLEHGDYPSEDFLTYISSVEKITEEEAKGRLLRFCDQLLALDAYAEMKVPNTGKFYVNAEGNLVFKHSPFPANYQPAVSAEKVIHPDASHTLLVGDKESNTTQMTEYYNVEEQVPRKKWWLAALILAIIGLAVIVFYFANEKQTGMFGNASKPALQENKQNYTTPQ